MVWFGYSYRPEIPVRRGILNLRQDALPEIKNAMTYRNLWPCTMGKTANSTFTGQRTPSQTTRRMHGAALRCAISLL
jgi:hypothetical protein